MKKNVILTSLAMMMAVQEQGVKYEREEKQKKLKEKKDIKPPIPKGCKEYYFYYDGSFTTNKMSIADIDCFFTCIASNEKTALWKFRKFSYKQEA